MPTGLLPLLLVVHVALAATLFLPTILLPFSFRTRRSAAAPGQPQPAGPVTQALLWLQANGAGYVGAGVALTGFGLIVVLGTSLISQPWLLVALVIYALNLVIAFFIQRPTLRRVLRMTPSRDDRDWVMLARRQRYVSYGMAALIGTIGFLMSQKPVLW